MKSELAPGAKNWISKYFHLAEEGEISFTENKEKRLVESLINTGLLYGVPRKMLFATKIPTIHFTKDEQLKLLLFEHLLNVYQSKYNDRNINFFLEKLLSFYGNEFTENLLEKFIPILRSETAESNVEKILAHRVKVKTPIFGTNYWLNHLSNCFVFLDVLLFEDFLSDNPTNFQQGYNDFAVFVLRNLVFAAYLDNQVIEQEQKILWRFLASAELNDYDHQQMEANILYGISDTQLKLHFINHKTLNECTFSLSIFLVKGTHLTTESEEEKINQLANLLQLNAFRADEIELLTEKFMLENQKDVSFVNSSTTNYLYKSFTRKWLRVLGRNKDKLIEELKESKELVALIQKSTKQELTKEEKEAVKEKFMDLLKSMPSVALFMLPGGSLLLPIILKLVPDLLPSSFKDNELD